MVKTRWFLPSLLLSGIILGSCLIAVFKPSASTSSTHLPYRASDHALQDTDTSPLIQRIHALETTLDQYSLNQAELEIKVEQLTKQLASVDALRNNHKTANRRPPTSSSMLNRRAYTSDNTQWKREQLEKAGFAPLNAEELSRKEGRLTMEIIQERYAAQRRRSSPPWGSYSNRVHGKMREELGDEDFDKYLFATGQPNRVKVSEVIDTSPAQQAGLAIGDTILSYDGERVFDMNGLIHLTHQGDSNDEVELEIKRQDGSIETLYLPRGPIGILGRGSQEPIK